MPAENRTRVLIVDDSAVVRRALTDMLSRAPDIEVVGVAPDPYIARDKILALNPDVLTLDIEMPRMDGLTFLGKLMQYHPLPVLVISSLGRASTDAAVEALRRGAVEVIAKPNGPFSVDEWGEDLARRVRAAALSRVRVKPAPPAAPAVAAPTSPGVAGSPQDPRRIIAIGASTGGTEAIEHVLLPLPESMPGMVFVQHIPAGFSRSLAGRLDSLCRLRVKEAEDGDVVRPGTVLLAPGNFHMRLERAATGYRVRVADGPKVHYQRPSVDVLFQSVAETAGAQATGVILTGMGSDGAEGLKLMRDKGAYTVAQDESSCVVFGMPREAIRMGAAETVAPLDRIAALLAGRAAAKSR